MKKTFFIVTILLSAFLLFSCKPKTLEVVFMNEIETHNDAAISGYIVEVGMTSITVHTDNDEIMIFNITEADMSRAIDAKAGDLITVFYLPPAEENEMPVATMVEIGKQIQEETNE